MSTTPPDVKVGHILLSLMRGLSDKSLRWTSVALSAGAVSIVMFRPMPWWCAVIGAGFAASLAPLWLRRDRVDGS